MQTKYSICIRYTFLRREVGPNSGVSVTKLWETQRQYEPFSPLDGILDRALVVWVVLCFIFGKFNETLSCELIYSIWWIRRSILERGFNCESLEKKTQYREERGSLHDAVYGVHKEESLTRFFIPSSSHFMPYILVPTLH